MRSLLIGATGTLGKAITTSLASENVEIIPVGRHSGDLQVTIASQDSIRSLFEQVGAFDGLICVAGSAYVGPLEKMGSAEAYTGINNKLMGQVNLVLIGREYVNEGGFFTLTSGNLAEEGSPNSADLALVKELGIRVLRYGLPYYKIHLGPDQYDWRWADQVMGEIKRLGIEPIMDLLHFGIPDWLGNFQNPDLPFHFSRFAGAFADRYSWVRYYTPVNEIFIAAKFSGREGKWNEQLKSDTGVVTALKHLVAASIMATIELAQRRPDFIVVQSESAEYQHELRPSEFKQAKFENKLRFLALDLLYGYPPDADVILFLLDNGMTRNELDWFLAGKPPGYQVLGNDCYGRNESITLPDGTVIHDQDIAGWYGTTKLYYQRYLKPLMHTETNTFDPSRRLTGCGNSGPMCCACATTGYRCSASRGIVYATKSTGTLGWRRKITGSMRVGCTTSTGNPARLPLLTGSLFKLTAVSPSSLTATCWGLLTRPPACGMSGKGCTPSKVAGHQLFSLLSFH